VLIEQDFEPSLVLALGSARLSIVSSVTAAGRRFVNMYLTSQLGLLMGNSVMHDLIRLPLKYIQRRHLGNVILRFESVKPIRRSIIGSPISVVIDGLLAFTTLAMLFLYSAKLLLSS
jgi:ATP-binding cassette subfamily B protein RaxB